MAVSKAISDCVDRALKDELKLGDGSTSKQSVLLRARADARKRGIDAEIRQLAENAIWMASIDRSMKRGLPDNVVGLVFRNAPPALVQAMRYLPRCISTGEGPEAKWVDSLKATPKDWRANAALKNKKANQTFNRAAVAIDVARFIEEYDMGSLSDAVDVEEEAA